MSVFKGLGAKLLTKDGLKATEEVLAGKKYVLTYFSAHWCPPCRRFTPELTKFYNAHKEAKGFEIVFVSLDRDEGQFSEYYGTMPWVTIPYDSDARKSFSQKFGGEGIPELIVFDASSEKVVTREGVSSVMEDEEAASFPWTPPTWEECLGEKVVSQDGAEHPVSEVLAGKTVGVYCSAHWCGPCRIFTPELAKFYAAYKAKDPNFEILFCSSDKSESQMMDYFKDDHAAYYCMPYEADARKKMQKYVNADGIPTFAVYSPEGKLINKNARAKVAAGVDAVVADGWAPPPVANLKDGPECQGVDLNSAAAVLIRCEGCDDDEQESCRKELEKVAKEYIAAADGTPEVIFFYNTKTGPISDQLSSLTKKNGSRRCAMPDDEPLMLLFNIPDQGAFYESLPVEVTADSIKSFIQASLGGKGTRLQLERA